MLGPDEPAGTLTATAAAEPDLPAGLMVGAGTGDNMAGALGLGAAAGEAVVSLGTSGTAFMRADVPSHDSSGEVCGFADATGGFLPLVCLVNCTRVVDRFAALVGLDRREALGRAAALDPGAEGLLLFPLLGGERTPNLPEATGELHGVTMENLRPETLLRAALDGVAANLAYAVERLGAVVGAPIDALTVVGGGAADAAWRQAIADATGLPVQRPAGDEHAARGAAVQAAALVRGDSVGSMAADWRPDRIEPTMPRPQFQAAFRLPERRALIAALG